MTRQAEATFDEISGAALPPLQSPDQLLHDRIVFLERREADLLASNNALLARARQAEADNIELKEAVLGACRTIGSMVALLEHARRQEIG